MRSEAMGCPGKCRGGFFSECLVEDVVDCLPLELFLEEGEWWRWDLDSFEPCWACSPSSIHCIMRWWLTVRKGMSSSLRWGRASHSLPSLTAGSLDWGSITASFFSEPGCLDCWICCGSTCSLCVSTATGAEAVGAAAVSSPATGLSL